MNIHFAPSTPQRRVKIKVVGVGGAGGNAVNRMIEEGLAEVDFYAINTDSQALESSRAHQTLVIGNCLTRGLGAGGDPEVGRQAAEEDRELLAALVEDTDMVFVTAGMGGGTGTGGAPLVAAAARASGALTVAVVTRPFEFEGRKRLEQADAGLTQLRDQVDALLVIPNERLMEIDVGDAGMTSVFKLADSVLYEATRGISDIIAQNAVVNLDFADVRTVMKDSGAAIMGTGRATGEGRARLAAEQAIRSPLLENVDIHGSRAVLVYLSAANVDRDDLRDAMNHVQSAAGSDAHIFFGFANSEDLGEDLAVTVIATGFPARAIEPVVGRTLEAVAGADDAAPPLPPAETEAAEAVRVADPAGSADAPAQAVASPVMDQPAPAEAAALVQVEHEADDAIPCEIDINNPGGWCVVAGQEAVEVEAAGPAVQARAPLADQPVVAPQPLAASQTTGSELAALAAAAGGQACLATVAAAPQTPEPPPAPATSQRFLEPMGTVRLDEQPAPVRPVAQRFRSSGPEDDKLRPAWERKYVD